ncbi:MAG: hypothetical protein HOM34_01545 [Planctomycetes bacterium]|jgi:hypothetical protein|nr:hypothetical protein [Planctomycetota bacterium]MBT4029578.1 hypothetical protein [Planctomycetota bacterium]MBT4560552.1 hypothetical protein [Planctomycetota bacterium]MBT5101583.1 hypothetical protein [Planctomycetota bacterium]MBT5119386.1 hypothetical protein [Planctomycetota bacterium]
MKNLSIRMVGFVLALCTVTLLSFNNPLPSFRGVLARMNVGANGMQLELQLKNYTLVDGAYAIGEVMSLDDPAGLFHIEAEVLSVDLVAETAQVRGKVEFFDPVLGGLWEGVNEMPFGTYLGSYSMNHQSPDGAMNVALDSRAWFAVYGNGNSSLAVENASGGSCDFAKRGGIHPGKPVFSYATPCHGDIRVETLDFAAFPPLTNFSVTGGAYDDINFDGQLPYGLYMLGFRD